MDKINYKYPLFDNNKFQKKITLKKEFNHRYIAEKGDIIDMENNKLLCSSKEFVLSPNQEFIKMFLHPNTPYNGVLLYHGMGSGKTCSAITVTEQFRTLNKYNNLKKILIVASPNVQQSFRLQLFDSNKLKKVNNIWQLEGCVGPELLHELKDYDVNNLNFDTIVNKINKIINNNYLFIGYEKLANMIEKVIKKVHITDETKKKKVIKTKLNSIFGNSLFVIDEAHNIRMIGGNKNIKKTAQCLNLLTTYVKRNKILLLTGTPMYNDPKEIVFLLNLLRQNDGLSKISVKEIFDKSGNFLLDKNGKNIGKSALLLKANGYVSYVRGENPYNFPFKIYPNDYECQYSIKNYNYPTTQYNGIPVNKPIEFLDLYMNMMSDFQIEGYHYFKDKIKAIKEDDTLETSGYKEIQDSLFALNICYPNMKDKTKFLSGKDGLRSVMSVTNGKFSYTNKDMNVFNSNMIGNYSKKIETILDHIAKSDGIILVYSQFIESGLIPIALALEEYGMNRINKDHNLFSKDALPKKRQTKYNYAMITGNIKYSSNNSKEIEKISHLNNVNGDQCKVVLISQAGSEGIDFKNLRQVHILEPWFNLNRIEQIIGRAIRNCSHKSLPLEKRNSQIFLHGSYINEGEECVDMWLYRKCEEKSVKIGKVQKVLKSVSIDCLLNEDQKSFSKLNQTIPILLSTKENIDYNLKDKSYSLVCDYQHNCDYECINKIGGDDITDLSTYSYEYVINSKLIEKIKKLFLKKHVYKREDLISLLTAGTRSSINVETIYGSLTYLIDNNNNDFLIDKFGRKGKMINIKDLYLFQPIEFDSYTSYYDKTRVLESTPEHLLIPKIIKPRISILNKANVTIKSSMKDKIEKVKENNKTKLLLFRLKNYYSDGYEIIGEIKDKNPDYYKNFSLMVNELVNISNGSIKDDIKQIFLIEHILETLTIDQEETMIQYLFNPMSNLTKLELLYKAYYETNYIFDVNGGKMLFLIDLKDTSTKTDTINNKQLKIYIKLSNDEMFRTLTSSELIERQGEIMNIIRLNNNSQLFKYVAFMGYSNTEDSVIIKTKNTQNKKNTGAFFIQSTPGKMIPLLNEMFGADIIKPKKYSKPQLCILLELISKHKTLQGTTKYYLTKFQLMDNYLK
uniref:Helicase n=1 Tax=Florenciella sp. virus SA2 TaxID=3240092 RepID=A0AB39J728_9VIRU